MRVAGADSARGRSGRRRTERTAVMSLPANLAANPWLNRWISFETLGVVRLRTGKVELGQGAVTAIAAIAAKELGVDIQSIRAEPTDTRISPDEGHTSGSFSIEH